MDVAARQVVQQFPYNIDSDNRMGDIDESDSILVLSGPYRAGTLVLADGSQKLVATGSALGNAVLVNGVAYITAFNDRGVIAAALDGSFTKMIKPFPDGPVSCPEGIRRSSDRSVLVYGDGCLDALQLIDPTTQSVVDTVPTGVAPGRFTLLSETEAVVTYGDMGTVAFFDLTHPRTPPTLIRVPSLPNLASMALNGARNQLLIAHRVPLDPTQLVCPDPYGDQTTQPEIVVLDLETKKVVERFRLDAIGKFQTDTVEANAMKVTPDGNTLVIASNGALYFVDLSTPCRLGKIFKGRFRTSPFYCFR